MNVLKSLDSFPSLTRRLWSHITQRRKYQFGLLSGLMLISSFTEVISLGAVLPFIGVLVAPVKVFEYPIIQDMAYFLGINSPEQLVLPLTITFAAAAIVAGIMRTILLWASTRLSYANGSDLSIEVYRRSLYQPYEVHASRNSSEVLSAMTDKANSVVGSVLLQLITLISSTVLLTLITFSLFIINPLVALISLTGFGVSYVLITWLVRKRLQRNGQRISEEQSRVIKIIQEGLGGIRDVLLDGSQQVYCDSYRKADHALRSAQGNNVFMSGSPRHVMEAVGIVLITILAYSLSKKVGGVASALPILGALALGAQRLLPALQNIFSSWASIVGSKRALADIVDLLDQPINKELIGLSSDPLKFNNLINFNDIRFHYSGDSSWVLDGINLAIPKGARYGFIGRTGSGKSTLLDLLMGLLKPTEGELLIDGKRISGGLLRAWQQKIAHVPQSIYLTDATLAENIAFSVPPEDIDLKRVHKAAKQAQISEYIESDPKGYDALVGERGIKLSGGQLQRIGIARALYKQPSILVFDEATSALDTETEHSVMDAIEGLDRSLTILIIAHRLTTLQKCDTIVELENGRVSAQGTYEQMIEAQSFNK
jgi:ATP-binding cassette, subfamily B, bacterial PglK